MEERVKNFRNQLTVEDYKEVKNSEYFNAFKKLFGFTDEDIKTFEDKYYPELNESECDKCETKSEIISREHLEELIEENKKYMKKVDKLGEFLSNCYDDKLPLVYIDNMFMMVTRDWLGEDKSCMLLDYLAEESDMTFDELYEALNA